MRISQDIERFLKELLNLGGGSIEIRRGEIAERFSCAPSQINYVIATRFTSQCGFFVESRRGGGGHIKITKIFADEGSFLMNIINGIGREVSRHNAGIVLQNCLDNGAVTLREARIMLAALESNMLNGETRAEIFKNMLVNLGGGNYAL